MSYLENFIPKHTHEARYIGGLLPVKTKMNVVGVDLSLTSTGVTTLTGDGVVDSYALPTTTKMGDQCRRQTIICEGVWEIVRRFEWLEGSVDLIMVEGYAMGVKSGQVFSLGELGGVFRNRFTCAGYQVAVIPPTSVKKFIGAGGGADKEKVKEALKGNYGIEFPTTDQTDATCIALAAYHLLLYNKYNNRYVTASDIDTLSGVTLLQDNSDCRIFVDNAKTID